MKENKVSHWKRLGCLISRRGALVVILLLLLSGRAASEEPLCEGELGPHLVLTTAEGSMVIELYEKAAPKTIRRLVKLVKGPIFRLELLSDKEKGQKVGYYDGLSFDYTKPHVEILTSARPPGGLVDFANEIDAEALGLHLDKVPDAGKAMDILQMELLKAFAQGGKKVVPGSLMETWMRQWYESYESDFLVGASRQQINEAMGHVYTKGLDSRPVTRGSVALKPAQPGYSSPRLSILLADIPQRTGQWMVIGRVAEGLDFAAAIALRPRAPGVAGFKFFQPASPLTIDSIRFECLKLLPLVRSPAGSHLPLDSPRGTM